MEAEGVMLGVMEGLAPMLRVALGVGEGVGVQLAVALGVGVALAVYSWGHCHDRMALLAVSTM